MIGYKITATSGSLDLFNYNDEITGWSEGDPYFKGKVIEKASKEVVKQIIIQAAKYIGTNSNVLVKVADIISKPFAAIAAKVGQKAAEDMVKIHQLSKLHFLTYANVIVTITGDFEATYLLVDAKDFQELPKLLALIPQQYSEDPEDQFMGANVIQSVCIAHVNFLGAVGGIVPKAYPQSRKSAPMYKLELEIEL